MIRHQELIHQLSGQSFFFDCPEGRPDVAPTPTVSVFLSTNSEIAGTELATTGAVAIDPVDTTIAGTDALAGASVLTVASGANIAKNRRYILTAADGSSEWIETLGINGAQVTLRRQLTNAYVIGSKFQSSRISIAVNATWIADQSRITDILGVTWRTDRMPKHTWGAGYAGYRVRWDYSVTAVATRSVSYADIVRYSAKNLVNPLDVDSRFPGWIDRLPTDYQHDQGASLLLEAFGAVKMDLIGDDQALRRVRNTEIIAELTVNRANVIAAENQVLAGILPEASLKVARELYARRYDQLAREPKFQVDQTSGGESAQAQRTPITRR